MPKFDKYKGLSKSIIFWSKVSKGNLSANECWIWLGRKTWNGYGMFDWTRKEPITAHIAAYKLTINPNYKSKLGYLDLSHICDNRLCVNPHHLIPKTHKANIIEAFEKGRIRRDGDFNPNSKNYISNPIYKKDF